MLEVVGKADALHTEAGLRASMAAAHCEHDDSCIAFREARIKQCFHINRRCIFGRSDNFLLGSAGSAHSSARSMHVYCA
jgi:hypothetical protein